MPDSYPFSVYSGIFEPKHYKNIGAALWFFLWCIKSSTGETVDEDGVTWGHVYKGIPLKLPDLAEPFGVNQKTVSRWIDDLEEHGYIRVTRAPYGLILAVKNSKKFLNKNVRSGDREQTNMSDLPPSDKTEMSDLLDKNVRSNNDLINKSITTITTDRNGLIELINAYCPLHNKNEFHLSDRERRLMIKMIGQGIPSPFIIRIMNQVHKERSADAKISSFLYYESPIYEAWKTEQAITEGVPISPVAIGALPITERVPAPTVAIGKYNRFDPNERKQMQNQLAKQKIREAEERERSRGTQAVLPHRELI